MVDMHARAPATPSSWPVTASAVAQSLQPERLTRMVQAFGAAYSGPERRTPAAQSARWLALMLDEIDYGMVLVVDGGRALHVNHAARAEIDGGHPIHLQGGEVCARRPADAPALREALEGAQRGLRRLLSLREDGRSYSVAVVPLGPLAPGAAKAALLLLGKRQVCERLSVQWFARCHALTLAETRVLEALCLGLDPREVAEQHGVGLATVRTQIGSIRTKTGAESLRDLVHRVAMLPPLVSSLRAAA